LRRLPVPVVTVVAEQRLQLAEQVVLGPKWLKWLLPGLLGLGRLGFISLRS
jgi:hypothetical protein